MSLQYIATCAFGLEAVVKRELEQLGLVAKVIQPGWVSFEGDEQSIIQTNLSLRTADRVLIQVAEFAAPDFDALFETTKQLNWGSWIPSNAQFPVKGRSIHSQLTSVPAVQRSVKRAIVEALMRDHGTNSLPESGAKHQIEISLRNDLARLTIDTTGPSLHKRGYRRKVGLAPLKETLAAAMIQLSVWNAQRPFIDPFCGSGTIAIEAAMIALRIAPGLNRRFDAENWERYSASDWNQHRAALQEVAYENRNNLGDRLIATDVDPEALSLARYHATQANVQEHIHFQHRAFEDLRSKREYGCLITNPPYGERLKERDMVGFYKSIPRILQRLPSWSHFILTAFPRFEAVIQKSATRRRKLYNGRIECMYYQFLGPKPPSSGTAEKQGEASFDNSGELANTNDSIQAPHRADESLAAEPQPSEIVASSCETEMEAASDDQHTGNEQSTSESKKPQQVAQPVFGGVSEKSLEQSRIFSNRLIKRAKHLRRWPGKGITCFRLYERDIPEIPLVVDRYEDYLHLVEFERPHDRDLAEHASWQDLMCKTAAQALGVDISHVFFKSKTRQSGKKQHEKLATEKSEVMVQEGGLKFLVNLSDYVDTGLFLDHRLTRDKFRSESESKRVLNLFGYTGAFTVYAADGGASSIAHVDASRTYVEWAQRNMSINRFHGPQYSFQAMSVQEFFQSLPEKPIFDLAIVDPPTFSNNKQNAQVWDIQQDHLELLINVRKRVSDGGVIYFSTNFRRFKMDDGVGDHFAAVREISRQTVPEDFRNKKIHRCWRLVT